MNQDHDTTPVELRGIEARVDAFARIERSIPDTGFEARITASAARTARGEQPLRIVHGPGRTPRRHVAWWAVRGTVAAALLAGAAWLGIATLASRSVAPENGVSVALVGDAEAEQIAAAWDLLADDVVLDRLDDLYGEAASLKTSIAGEWSMRSLMEEESM